ncbi:UNKNOWN [Stylonychia lemnae]|uniref:Uncharacterized protein n=1 Tax=Stylonychia lemnae TaxID=5949 RepID=A0A078B6N8_STYLE|nr:UNKNOWN [Stylonychia lemnae]|eukprot:CDW89228.1 UNKNOWN [Stylonychia lemnae]
MQQAALAQHYQTQAPIYHQHHHKSHSITQSPILPSASITLKPQLTQTPNPNYNSFNKYKQYYPNDLIRSHHGKSISLMVDQNFVGKIGWGMEKPVLNESPRRNVLALEDQPHKSYWDKERYNFFLKNNGNFSTNIDKKTSTHYDQYQLMDLKSLRQMIKDNPKTFPKKMKNLYFVEQQVQTHIRELDIDQGRTSLLMQVSSRLNGMPSTRDQVSLLDMLQSPSKHSTASKQLDAMRKSQNRSFNHSFRNSNLNNFSIREEIDEMSPRGDLSLTKKEISVIQHPQKILDSSFQLHSFKKQRFSSLTADNKHFQSLQSQTNPNSYRKKIEKCPKMQKHMDKNQQMAHKKLLENSIALANSSGIYDQDRPFNQSFDRNYSPSPRNILSKTGNNLERALSVINSGRSNQEGSFGGSFKKKRSNKVEHSIDFQAKLPDLNQFFKKLPNHARPKGMINLPFILGNEQQRDQLNAVHNASIFQNENSISLSNNNDKINIQESLIGPLNDVSTEDQQVSI